MVSSDPARDLLYAGAACLGASIAVALSSFVYARCRSSTVRARRFFVASCLLSGAIAFLALALIAADEPFFADRLLLSASSAVFVLSFAAVMLPGLFGFPLIVVSLSALVLFAWSFLVYPGAADGVLLCRARLDSSGTVLVWFGGDDQPEAIDGCREGGLPSFDIVKIDFDRLVPFVGSTARAAALSVSCGGSVILRPTRRGLSEMVFASRAPDFFIVPGVSWASIPVEGPVALRSGARFDLYLEAGRPRLSQR